MASSLKNAPCALHQRHFISRGNIFAIKRLAISLNPHMKIRDHSINIVHISEGEWSCRYFTIMIAPNTLFSQSAAALRASCYAQREYQRKERIPAHLSTRWS